MSKPTLTIAVATLTLTMACQAKATNPTVTDAFQRSFTLDRHQHREFHVMLLESTEYEVRVTSEDSGQLKLRVQRFWNGEKKFDRHEYGHGEAGLQFESSGWGVRPYVVTVCNESHHAQHLHLTIRKCGGAGGGHHHQQELFPAYSVDFTPGTFQSYLNRDSLDQDEYRIHFKADYVIRSNGANQNKSYEFRKNINGERGRSYQLNQGTSGAGGLVSNVTLYSNVFEHDTGDRPDAMGEGHANIILEQLRWEPGQRVQLVPVTLEGRRGRNRAYTLTVQVKITRYSVDRDGNFVSPDPPPESQSSGQQSTQRTQDQDGGRSQGRLNPVLQVISGGQADLSNWLR